MQCFWGGRLSGRVTPVVQPVSARQAFAALTTAWHDELVLVPSDTLAVRLGSSPVRPLAEPERRGKPPVTSGGELLLS